MLRIYQLDRLSECLEFDDVDIAMDELEIEQDNGQRVLFLYQHMGISQSFTSTGDSDGLTMDEEYTFAKHQLVLMNKRRIEKEKLHSKN